MKKILVIHGPNLHLLGQRETPIYGKATIGRINQDLEKEARVLKVRLKIVQSNHEGKIVDLIGAARQGRGSPAYGEVRQGRPRAARKGFQGILINPAAYTHTSVAIRDALLACGLPAVEVHLSNIYQREEFRQHSLTAPACIGTVAGFGKDSYILGLRGLVSTLKGEKIK